MNCLKNVNNRLHYYSHFSKIMIMLIHDHNFRKKSGDGNFEKRYFKANGDAQKN